MFVLIDQHLLLRDNECHPSSPSFLLLHNFKLLHKFDFSSFQCPDVKMKTESKCKHKHEHGFCSFDCEETKGGRKKNLHSRSNSSSRFRRWVVQEGVNKFRVEEFFLVPTEASTNFAPTKKQIQRSWVVATNVRASFHNRRKRRIKSLLVSRISSHCLQNPHTRVSY
jgi:hypothetical protein